MCLTSRLYRAKKGGHDGKLVLPPGPPPLAVIGNLLSLGRLPHRSLHDLSLTYGPILKLSLGRITTVIVSSPSLARDIIHTHGSCFSNRFVPNSLTAHDHDRLGLSMVPISPLFKMLRRIYNTHVFAARKLDGNRHLHVEHARRLVQEVAAGAEDGRAELGVLQDQPQPAVEHGVLDKPGRLR